MAKVYSCFSYQSMYTTISSQKDKHKYYESFQIYSSDYYKE